MCLQIPSQTRGKLGKDPKCLETNAVTSVSYRLHCESNLCRNAFETPLLFAASNAEQKAPMISSNGRTTRTLEIFSENDEASDTLVRSVTTLNSIQNSPSGKDGLIMTFEAWL